MDFWGDRRGQPVQIGFILLFGILVLAFASYQGYVVPNQNGNIEVDHFETVSDQFAEFDTNAVNTIGNDVERSTAFDLGVQYPSRLIALNPPPVSGRLETTAPRRVSVVNGSGDTKTAEICGSSQATSRSLVYTPRYNEYREARSTTYENTVVTRSFREQDLHGDQRLVRSVDGGPDRIDLLLLNRSVSVDRQGTYSLKLEGSHRYSRTVENATVTIATQYSATTWEEEILADRGDVSASDAGDGQVNLTFDGGDYEVSCAVVGLNGEPAFEPPAAGDDSSTFDTRWVEADGETITNGTVTVAPGEKVELTSEATDSSTDLPISDAQVDFSLEGSQDDVYFVQTGQMDSETDEHGFANATIEVDSGAQEGDEYEAFVTIGDDADYVTIVVASQTNDQLTIDGLSATSTNHQSHARFDVDFSASAGNAGITEATLELIDDGGVVVDTADFTYNEADQVNEQDVRLEDNGGAGAEYTIRLTVTDADNNQVTDQITETA